MCVLECVHADQWTNSSLHESLIWHALKEKDEIAAGVKCESEICDGIVEVTAVRLFAQTGQLARPGPAHVTRPL